jgi:hypothetical protein
MTAFGNFFKQGSIGEQLLIWGVLNQLIEAVLTPATQEIEQNIAVEFPFTPLSPADAATAVNRGFLTIGDAAAQAARSGVDPTAVFPTMVHLAGDAPGPGDLVEALRRGIIPATTGDATDVSFQNGIRQGNLDDKWTAMMQALGIQPPSAGEIIDALVQSQLPPAEALTRYAEAGGDPTWFDTAFGSAGDAPGPQELITMLNRGIIDEGATGPDSLTFEQGIAEGRTRNKWTPKLLALRYYVPPPRTVSALLKEGAINQAQAAQYFAAAGLDPALTAIYLKAGTVTAETKAKELSEATVVGAYESGLLTNAEALADLVTDGYTEPEAALLLAYADKKAATAASKAAVTRLQTLYLAGTHSLQVTEAALHELGLTDDSISTLIATWNLEQSVKVKELTEGQIVAGWFYGAFGTNTDAATIQTVVGRLVALGYSQPDALVLLGARYHSPITLNGPAAP